MAHASLVSLAQILEEILYHDQHNILVDYEKQPIKSLHENIIFLQNFLEEFQEKGRHLEARIREVAREAKMSIEYFISDKIQPVQRSHTCMADFLFSVLFTEYCLLPCNIRVEGLFDDLLEETREIDSIVEEAIKIKKNNEKENESSIHSFAASSSSTLPPLSKDTVMGFDDDLFEIKSRLCDSSSKLEIIPIVGMGGIGKTTLAKLAYEDPLIEQHFDVCAWVTLSQDFRIREILQGILLTTRTSSNEERGRESDELLREIAYKSLKGRRYLVVLDDIWSTNAWDDLKWIFPDDYNGSRIVMTTRLSNVGLYMDSSNPLHQLQFMDDDRSWNLLRQKVFGQEEHCPLELEEIGKKISRNCKGLPLALVVIGGIISKIPRTIYEWEKIANVVRTAVNTGDVSLSKILSLSYDHLPHHLKSCFLYIGGFPEDSEIRTSYLIKLWVAEGFLKPSRFKSFEEVAEDNLEDLVKRNLILVISRNYNGKIKTLRIHDLLRDFSLTKAHDENFLHLYSSQEEGNKLDLPCQRISSYPFRMFETITGSYHLNSRSWEWRIPLQIQGYKLLRILDFLKNNFEIFPVEVVELFHLRYLALSLIGSSWNSNSLKELKIPPSIIKLQNLQTLIVRKGISKAICYLYLPSDVWKMPKLRHLILFETFLPDLDDDVFAVINLQTLSSLIDITFDERILRILSNVKKLGLTYNECTGAGLSQYHLNNLVHLHRLETLNLKGDWSLGEFSRNLVCFPPSLKKLTLKTFDLPWKHMTILGSLPNLQVLKLNKNRCAYEEWETNEGEFPKLKMLSLEILGFYPWTVESSHFPRLEHLIINHCFGLKAIPFEIGEIPTLQLIELDKWNESLWKSAKMIQEEQQSFGNDVLQVREYTPSWKKKEKQEWR